jgi:hypothetical protein
MADFSALTDDRAALAAELATRLLPVPEVMKRYNMTTAELTTLLADSQFKNMVRDFRREWESPMSARERVKLKSSLAVEDGIVELYRIFKDLDTVPAARIDAFKQLVGLADMQPKKEGAEAGPAFSLTLNLGGTDEDISKTITIDADADATLPRPKSD